MSDATLSGLAAATPAAGPAGSAPVIATRPVSLVDLDVSFFRLVVFFVKAGLAAIPAIIIVMLTLGVVGALLRGLFRIGFWGMHGGYYSW